MSRPVIFAALILALLASGLAMAADWPQFRGPNADGISRETGIGKDWNAKPPTLLWKTAMGDQGYAGPSVAGGKVFIIDHSGTQDIVRAIDVATGKDVWKYAYTDDAKANFGYSRATPTVSGSRVYALGRMGLLNCLDTKTGKLLWQRNICADFKGNNPGWHYAMSVVIDGNKAIVCPGGPGATVVALDKTTGKTIWQGGGTHGVGYSTPVIATIRGVKQYVFFTETDVIGVNPNSGETLWSFAWSGKPQIHIPQPVVIGDSVFLANGYGEGCGLIDVTEQGAAARWTSKDMQPHMASPILTNGLMYGNSDPDGALVCLDPMTGAVKWRQSGFEKGPLSMVDGVLLAFDGKSGALVMVDPQPDAYKELGRFTPLGGQSWTMPVVANGCLFVRNQNELACFSLK